jgi:hypothetical protein
MPFFLNFVMARLDPRLRGEATQPARICAPNEYFITWMARVCGP